jgi:hypothetical protein
MRARCRVECVLKPETLTPALCRWLADLGLPAALALLFPSVDENGERGGK